MLVGGVLGDALGGPVEFQQGPRIDAVLPCVRDWPADRKLTADEREKLARTLPLLSYEKLRPSVEPYGQWTSRAPAGTVTDDTRHKIVLMRTLRAALSSGKLPLSNRNLARQYLSFTPHEGVEPDGKIKKLADEAFQEYRYAARWLLGERDPRIARPLERLWSGIDTCSGQMMLPPLAAAYPGQPEKAYLAAYSLDFIDAPGARDMAAAMVAGLAAVLARGGDGQNEQDRWRRLFEAMRDTDPYGYADVPFAGRPLRRWLDTAEKFAGRAQHCPARLFELLEHEGRPLYWWDAHFTLLVPLAVLHLCEFDPLASLHLTLDFRHDTDSYAQLLGTMVGAVHGEQIFPVEMRQTVGERLIADYGEDLAEWDLTLKRCAEQRQTNAPLVAPLEQAG